MAHWRRFLVAGVGILTLLAAGTVSAGAHVAGGLIEFDSMTPVTGAAASRGRSRPARARSIAAATSR